MGPFQIVALIAVGLGAAVYIWRGVRRATRVETEFHRSLVQQLARLLEPKGFRLTRNVTQLSGLRIATFVARGFVVEAVWDAREREISLIRRTSQESEIPVGGTVARAHVPEGATADVYAAAGGAVLDAAAALDGAA